MAAARKIEDDGPDYLEVAERYARDVVAGRVVACKWVKLACKRHLDDLKRSKADKAWPFYFDQWHAADVCDFSSKLPHIEGKWTTATIVLAPWQVACLCMIFGWRRRSDKGRRFSKIYWELARKQGKSTLAAVVALYCFCCEDEPAPYIFIGATTGAQAQKVFHPARMMAMKTPDLCEAFGLKVWAKSITEPGGGYIQTINSKGSTQDGHNPAVAILDELHAHKDRALYDVLDSAFGARTNPLMWIITTAGFDTTGVCFEQRAYLTKVLEGVIEADHFWGIIYTLDDDEVEAAQNGVVDPKVWVKANPNLGVSVHLASMQSAAKEAAAQPGKLGEFLTKRLNIWTTARRGHINVSRWKACNGAVDLAALRSVPCWGGFDLASTNDMTSFRLVWKLDETLLTFGFRYLPEAVVEPRSLKNGVPYQRWARMPMPGDTMGGDLGGYLASRKLLTTTPGDTTDYAYVEKDIRWALATFNVRMVGYDPYNAQDLVNRLSADGVPLGIVRQGGMTLSGPMKELDRLYLSGHLAHGGDEVLTWCASNVVPRPDHNDNLAPSKRLSSEKIDDYAALLNAMAAMLAEKAEAPMNVASFLDNLVMG